MERNVELPHPAFLRNPFRLVPLYLFLDICNKFNAVCLSIAIFSAALSVRIRELSSLNVMSRLQCKQFSTLQWSRVGALIFLASAGKLEM